MILTYDGIVPTVPKSAFVADTARVIGDVVLGEGTSVWYGSVIRGDVNWIRIGDRVNIQDLSVVHVTTGAHPTTIGHRVTVGHRAIVHGCTIADDVLIGMGAIILDGAEISRYSLVAAGSVVAPGKKFPERTLLMGSPAQVKRTLTDDEIAQLRVSADHYVALAEKYRTLVRPIEAR